MADDYGLGTGIGVGLSKVGQALQGYADRKNADREKQADKYEAEARSIAANIAQVGRDSPEAQPLVQQLYRTVNHHNALYKAHETPFLIARIQRFLGKTPAPPRADIRATMTPDQIMASTATTQPTLQQQYTQIAGIMKRLHPDETPEQIAERVEPVLFPARTGSLKPYRGPNGEIDWFPPGYQPAGWQGVAYSGQLKQQHTPDQVAAVAMGAANFGGKIPTDYVAEVDQYFLDNPDVRPPAGTIRGFARDDAGNPVSVLIYKSGPNQGQIVPGSEDKSGRILAPANYYPQVGEHVAFYTDAQNRRQMVRYTTTTAREIPGQGTTAPAAPAAPAGTVPSIPETAPATGAAPTVGGTEQPGAAPPVSTAQPQQQQQGPLKPGEVRQTDLGPAKLNAQDEGIVKQAKAVLTGGPELISEIQRFADKMGPIKGRIEEGKIWAGYYSDVRKLDTDMKSFASLQPKFHGARGVSAIQFFENASAKLHDDPRNAIQAIQGLMQQATNFLIANGVEYEDLPQKIWVQVPGFKPSQIDKTQFDRFFQKYPNATMPLQPSQ